MEDILNRHYAALLGLGEEWNVTGVKPDVAARRAPSQPTFSPWNANVCREAFLIRRSGSESPTARSFSFKNVMSFH